MVGNLAYDCFPNCHPANQGPYTGIQQTGSAGLALAIIGLIILLWLNRRGR